MVAGVRAYAGQGAPLLLAAQRGERDAQALIFTAHRDRVAQQIMRMTGNATAVDDLVQEVFIAAFLALPGFRGDAQLSTWLYSIAANKVRNWWESQRRRRARELAHAPSEEATLSRTPEDDLMAAEQRQRFYAALGGLPDRLREAFVARAVEGMSLVEAADALGAPVSTISYRARRAEELLCGALGLPWRGDAT